MISPVHTVGTEAGCCKLLFDEVSDCDNTARLRSEVGNWKPVASWQTGKPISATSGPKVTILWGHLEEEILLLREQISWMLSDELRKRGCTVVNALGDADVLIVNVFHLRQPQLH